MLTKCCVLVGGSLTVGVTRNSQYKMLCSGSNIGWFISRRSW